MGSKGATLTPSLDYLGVELENGTGFQSNRQVVHALQRTSQSDLQCQSRNIGRQVRAPVRSPPTLPLPSTPCGTPNVHQKQACDLHTPNHSQAPRPRSDGIPSRVGRMARLEVQNISWWVAQAFTWGSVVWVVNGFVGFLPFATSIQGEAMILAEGWTAFIGATIFEMGSVLGILEVWNRNDGPYSRWGGEKPLESGASRLGSGRRCLVEGEYAVGTYEAKETNILPMGPKGSTTKWIWFSADPRYFRQLGFQAAFWQLLGATIFWISGYMAIPPIQAVISQHIPVLNGVFWTPQVIGGSGFIISSIFTMLEAQNVWWQPAVGTIGWQSGFWNLIGAIGFTLCGAFGFFARENHGLEYQSSLCAFWAGWAFLIGSVFQWYDGVNTF